MEVDEPSFEVENLVSTPTDEGFPFPSPTSHLPPVQPSHTNLGRLRPEIAARVEKWESPDLSSAPTERELVKNFLRPVLRPPGLPKESPEGFYSRWSARWDRVNNPAAVNAGLPSVNPPELPGTMAGKQGRREKYYLTDHHKLCLMSDDQINTPNGFWIRKGPAYGGLRQWAHDMSMGFIKKTYIWKDTSRCVGGIETNWTMNVYGLLDGPFMEEELVLCHVFEGPPDYGAKPNPHTFVQGGCGCSGKHHHEGINASTNTSFYSIARGSSPMHHGPRRSRDPRLTSYIAMLEGVLLGDQDPDPDSSMDNDNYSPTRGVSPTDNHGHKRKKKSSDVWDYFTKIYAHDLEGNVVTLAACNHCSKVLTGSSKGGTTHLARHACPCKFKPVQAGRMDKGCGNVNVLSS